VDGRSVELGLEFGVEAIDVANVDVVGEAAISRGCSVGAVLLEDAEPAISRWT
jgi:hypothetical protein